MSEKKVQMNLSRDSRVPHELGIKFGSNQFDRRYNTCSYELRRNSGLEFQ